MIQAAVAGAAGRMGKTIIAAIDRNDSIRLCGATEKPGHPQMGTEVPRIGDAGADAVTLVPGLSDIDGKVDVLIDFTAPRATLSNLAACVELGVAAVVGTTGLSPGDLAQMEELAAKTPVVWSPNMSVAVNLLFKLAATAAAALGEEYDTEIVETHHRMKRDAPSGTALGLAEAVASATGRSLAQDAVFARHGMVGERTRREIGIQALRAGDIVGEHTLLLAGPGERLELTHRAHSRDNFAGGAIKAALWIAGQPAGLYSMADVLGLS